MANIKEQELAAMLTEDGDSLEYWKAATVWDMEYQIACMVDNDDYDDTGVNAEHVLACIAEM